MGLPNGDTGVSNLPHQVDANEVEQGASIAAGAGPAERGSTSAAPPLSGGRGLAAGGWSLVVRRRRWLVLVAVATGLLSGATGVVWNWLLPPSGGVVASFVFAVGLWILLFGAVVTVVVLVDRRPRRRVVVVTLLVMLVALPGAPAGWFWTFAVSHGPDGAQCPECAVLAYLDAGPLGGDVGANSAEFDAVLCVGRRDELRRQAQTIRDEARVLEDGQLRYFRTEYNGSTTTVTAGGQQATVRRGVYFVYARAATSGNAGATWDVDAGTWTFHLIDSDGWQVCGVDTPDICTQVFVCDPAKRRPVPSPSPSDDDPLGRLRSALPCQPLDPLREWHHCPLSEPQIRPSRFENSLVFQVRNRVYPLTLPGGFHWDL